MSGFILSGLQGLGIFLITLPFDLSPAHYVSILVGAALVLTAQRVLITTDLWMK